jgi:hypothetical protein
MENQMDKATPKEKCEVCKCDLNSYGDCSNLACPEYNDDDSGGFFE